MTSYYTRAKARSDLECEELEQRDVALVATTSTSTSILPVGLYDVSTGESESVSAETAWPTTTSTQPCIPPGSLNRVPASARVRAGMSPLPGGR